MSTFLEGTVSLSLSGGIVILALLIIRPFLQNKMSRKWQYYIWLLAVARLLLPIALPVNLMDSVFIMFKQQPAAAAKAQVPHIDMVLVQSEFEEDAAKAMPEEKRGTIQAAFWVQMAVCIWAAAALTQFARKTASYRSFVRFVKAGRKEAQNEQVIRAYDAACETLEIKKAPAVFVNSLLSSPMLVGVWHPFIVLPDQGLEENDAYYIFLHELTHVKRRDVFYKWAVQTVVCLHWFNPLVYWMRKEVDWICELSCDEAVIRQLAMQERRAYGDTLLRSIRRDGSYTSEVVSVTLGEDAKMIKERLCSIMKYRKRSRTHFCFSLLVSIILTCGAVLCGFSSPAYTQKQQTSPAGGAVAEKGKPVSSVFSDGERIYTTEHYYSHQYFFENTYIIGIAWNVDQSKYPVTRQIEADRIYTVAFSDKAKKYGNDDGVLEAVRLAIAEQIQKNSKTESFQLLTPLVTEVSGPYSASADALAKKFYTEDNLVYFSAVAPKASDTVQSELRMKAYQEEEIAFFGALQKDSKSEQDTALALQAYDDKEIAFFSMLKDNLSNAESAQLALRAYDDGEIAFFSVLKDSLSKEQISKLRKRAYDDGEIAFFSVLSD